MQMQMFNLSLGFIVRMNRNEKITLMNPNLVPLAPRGDRIDAELPDRSWILNKKILKLAKYSPWIFLFANSWLISAQAEIIIFLSERLASLGIIRPNWGTPLNPQYHRTVMLKGLQGALNMVHMMPIDISLPDSCTPHRCCFSAWIGRYKLLATRDWDVALFWLWFFLSVYQKQ